MYSNTTPHMLLVDRVNGRRPIRRHQLNGTTGDLHRPFVFFYSTDLAQLGCCIIGCYLGPHMY